MSIQNKKSHKKHVPIHHRLGLHKINWHRTGSLENKKLVLFVIALIAVLTALALANKYVQLNNAEKIPVTTNITNNQPAPQAVQIPADIQKIMDNNVTGTVASIDKKSLTLSESTGITYNLDENSFVLEVVNNELQNKKITDIKVGTKIYLQYDPDTKKALTITILQ